MRKLGCLGLLFFSALAGAQTINYVPPPLALATSSNGQPPYTPYTAASGIGQVNFVPDFFVPMCSSNGLPPYSQCTFGGGGTGVTSITWSMPSFMSASPVTLSSAGTETFAFTSQAQNLTFASPNGASGLPTFRALTTSDVPSSYPTLSVGPTGQATQVSPGMMDARLCSGLAVQTSSDVTSQMATCLATASAANLSLYLPYQYTVNYVRIPNGTDIFCDSKNKAGFLQDPTGSGNPGGGDTNYATVAIQSDSSNVGIGIHNCLIDGNKANIYATGGNPGNTQPIAGVVIEHTNATGGHPRDNVDGTVIQNATGDGLYVGPHDYDSRYEHDAIYQADGYGLHVAGVSDVGFLDFNIGQSALDGVYVLDGSNVQVNHVKAWYSGQGQTFALTSVATSSGGHAVYTGTFTTTQNLLHRSFQVSGFLTSANNGTFTVSAVTGTTITLSNASAVAETDPATATAYDAANLVVPGNYAFINASVTAGSGGWTASDLLSQDALGSGFYFHGNASQTLTVNATGLQDDSPNYALETGNNGACFDLFYLANSIIEGTCGKWEQGTPGIPTHGVNISSSTGNTITVTSNSLSSNALQNGDLTSLSGNTIVWGRIPLYTGTFASSYTPAPQSHAIEEVTLTGNVTIGAPLNSLTFPGMTLGLYLNEDATGGRTVTWNSEYTVPASCAMNTAASAVNFFQFQALANNEWILTGCGNPAGSGGGGSVTDGSGTSTALQFAESTSTAHAIQYRTPVQALGDMGAAAANPNQIPETASFTAACGNSYRITSGTVTVSLPSSGSTGCLISVQNVASAAATISSGTVTYNGPSSLAQNQNTLIQFDGTNFNGSYPPTGSGGSITGSGLTTFAAYYLNSSGTLTLAEANALAPSYVACIAATTSACQYRDLITNGSWSWTPGLPVYLSDSSAGGLTQTAPSTSGHYLVVVGLAVTATEILPNLPTVTVAGIQ